ncbi:hypothetical protein C8R47DRAFT_1062782 [Mycena vitilis]|nr:hypothetical protein C8R47DRAFT_1062782 [Mycena vitilis]
MDPSPADIQNTVDWRAGFVPGDSRIHPNGLQIISDATQPILPPDLERLIFEDVALSRPVSIPGMMRVAWRVKHWVEPLLYRTLVFGPDECIMDGLPRCNEEILTLIARGKPQSFLHAVRNVMAVLIDRKTVTTIMSECSQIDNLFVSTRSLRSGLSSPSGFEKLSLRRLSCDLDDFHGHFSYRTTAFSPFLYLTHLELFRGLESFGDSLDQKLLRWSMLATLPKLTHLALGTELLVCVHLLAVCESLKALILRAHHGHRLLQKSADLDDVPVDDMRFIVTVLPNNAWDWQLGVLGGADLWARADALIAKRMSGKINRTSSPNLFAI